MVSRNIVFSRYSLLFLLILSTTIVYIRSLTHEFVWDDLPLINENPQLRKLENIPSFFLPYYWKYDHPGTKGQYRPLRAVSLALSYHFWKYHPFGYHLTNLILHILNVLLVYLVVIKLFGREKIALLTALLFSLHPIHTESVSWLKNRTDLLALIFSLLSFSFYIKYIPVSSNSQRAPQQPLWLILSALGFILALMGKETAIVLPIILFFYLLYFHPYPENKGLFPSLLPFLGIAAFYLCFCFIFINKGLPPDPQEIAVPPKIHLFLIIQTLASYLSLIFLPINLNAERLMDIPSFLLNSSLLLSISLLVLTLSIYLKYFLPPHREGFAIAWFFISLLPVMNIIFMSGRPLAEQRLYIPSVGFCLFITLILDRWLPSKLTKPHSFPTWLGTGLTISILSCYTILTLERDKVWHNNLTLWEDTIAKSPQTFRTHFNLGSALTDKGEYDRAISEFEKSIKLNPKDHESYTSLGAAYYRKGDMEKAKEMFIKAIEMASNSHRAHNNLGNVYTVEGKTDLALKEYQEAIKIKPDFAEAYYNMGNAYKDSGDLHNAITAFAKAIEYEPGFSQSYYNLGNCYLLSEERDKARLGYEKAIQLEPTFIDARYNLANLYFERKAYPQAIEQFHTILRLNPNHLESHYVLGSIYSEMGKPEEALKEFQEVVRIFPDHAEARNSLGKLYMQRGEIEKGKVELHKALELDPQNGFVHYNLGKLYVSQRDYQSAKKEFEKALDLNPTIAEAWYNLGVMLHKQGDDAAAIEALKKALAVNPDYFDAHFHLGNLYVKQKQFELAVKSFKEALRIQPNNVEVHLKLGLVSLYNLNDAPQALFHLRKVLQLDPHHAHAAIIRDALALLQ